MFLALYALKFRTLFRLQKACKKVREDVKEKLCPKSRPPGVVLKATSATPRCASIMGNYVCTVVYLNGGECGSYISRRAQFKTCNNFIANIVNHTSI